MLTQPRQRLRSALAKNYAIGRKTPKPDAPLPLTLGQVHELYMRTRPGTVEADQWRVEYMRRMGLVSGYGFVETEPCD